MQPRLQAFGRFTTPMLYMAGSADNPCAVGTAVRCEPERGAFATPFLSPACVSTYRKAESSRCFHLFSSAQNSPETGLDSAARVFFRPLRRNRHTGPHGGSQGVKKTAGTNPAVCVMIFPLHSKCRAVARRLFLYDSDIFFEPLLFQSGDHFSEGGKVTVHSIGFQRLEIFQTVFLCNGDGEEAV